MIEFHTIEEGFLLGVSVFDGETETSIGEREATFIDIGFALFSITIILWK